MFHLTVFAMSNPKTQTNKWETTLKKTTASLLIWTAAWTGTVALIAFGPKFLWGFNMVLSALALLLNIGVGIVMVIVNIKHLRSTDEMDQKIVLEAAALTLGITLIFGGNMQLWDTTNLIPIRGEISYLLMVMGITLMISLLGIRWRYR